MDARPHLSNEAGFGIIEVLVSALIVVIVSLGVLAAVDAAGRTSDSNRSRSIAANLAQSDQERLRSLKIPDLANRDETRPVSADGGTYQVRSQAEYVIGEGGSTDCATNEETPRYLKITSTVTWDNMRGVSPVRQDSLRAMPNGTIRGKGSLAVDVNNRLGPGAVGGGVAGTPVSISGPANLTLTTNAEGCVIFGFIPVGEYTITINRAGYVKPKLPNEQLVTETAIVGEGAIASKSVAYDLAGAARVQYQTTAFGTTTVANTAGDGFSVFQSGLELPFIKTVPHASISTAYTSNKVLFPFTTPYEIWSGLCEENRLPAALRTGQQVTVPPNGNNATTVNLREPRIRVQAKVKNSTGGTISLNGGRVTIRPVTSGCTGSYAATTPSTGQVENPMPYGRYIVCAQNKAVNPTAKVESPVLTSATATGTLINDTTTPALPVIPYTTSTTLVPVCAT